MPYLNKGFHPSIHKVLPQWCSSMNTLVQNFTTQRRHSADSSSTYPKLRPLPSHSHSPLFPTGASRRQLTIFLCTTGAPYFSLSPSPFPPAYSKKPSRPLAWMLRTLGIVSAGVAQHMHISQGCLITSSSCTGTGARTLINFICLCLWQRALVSPMLWLPRSLIQRSQVTIFFLSFPILI